ncbi:hypothetical protein A2U01_0107734, partial [Trifolium medium]|nr:hypothetical protein [Trifolium medium]
MVLGNDPGANEATLLGL